MAEAKKKPEALIHIYIGRKTLLWGVAAVAACAAVYGIFSDTLTMTAFYPAPNAVYYHLLSTQTTLFNYCPPNNNPCAPNPVLIGTNIRPPVNYTTYTPYNLYVDAGSPTTLGLYVGSGGPSDLTINGVLNAQGGLQPGSLQATPSCSQLGLIAVVGGTPSYCDGSNWQQL